MVGVVPNVVSEIGSTLGGNKVVGIKSGYTSEAKGCLVLAADRVIVVRSADALAKVTSAATDFVVVMASADAERESAGIHRQTVRPAGLLDHGFCSAVCA